MTFQENVHNKLMELEELIIKKQHDYGPGNILNTPVDPKLGVLIRLNDKLQRAGNLIQKNREPANEPLVDTGKDICGYGLIFWMLSDDTFESSLKNEQ